MTDSILKKSELCDGKVKPLKILCPCAHTPRPHCGRLCRESMGCGASQSEGKEAREEREARVGTSVLRFVSVAINRSH